MKNVAVQPSRASASSTAGVPCGSGPSSKVNATLSDRPTPANPGRTAARSTRARSSAGAIQPATAAVLAATPRAVAGLIIREGYRRDEVAGAGPNRTRGCCLDPVAGPARFLLQECIPIRHQAGLGEVKSAMPPRLRRRDRFDFSQQGGAREVRGTQGSVSGSTYTL